MDGGSSTTTGLGTDDGGAAPDHQQRLLNAAAHLRRAQEVLSHKVTHETAQASELIRLALEEVFDVEAPGEGIEGSEGLHGEDPEEA
jgi:hypothetical protein